MAYYSALKMYPAKCLLRMPLNDRRFGRQNNRWEHAIKMGLKYRHFPVILS
jgi:hypothetical protein